MLRRVVAALPVLLLAAAGLAAVFGWTTWMSAVVPFVLCLLVGVALFVRHREEGDSVLGLASTGERTGRYAESGGLAREEQDRALAAIQEQGDELDEK